MSCGLCKGINFERGAYRKQNTMLINQVGNLVVEVEDENGNFVDEEFYISYCPICGEELREEVLE